MTSAQVVKTSVTVTDNSPLQDYPHRTITLHDRLKKIFGEKEKPSFSKLRDAKGVRSLTCSFGGASLSFEKDGCQASKPSMIILYFLAMFKEPFNFISLESFRANVSQRWVHVRNSKKHKCTITTITFRSSQE